MFYEIREFSMGPAGVTIRSLADTMPDRRTGEDFMIKPVRETELNALARLWQELAEAPAAEHEAALRHCFAALCRTIGAANAAWVGIRRDPGDDPYAGWRIRATDHFHNRERLLALGRQIAERIARGEVDPYVVAMARLAGRPRCHLRAELVSEREWRQCWTIHEVFAEERIADRLDGGMPVGTDCEVHFVLDRCAGEPPFAERERDLLRFFLLGARGFLRETLLARGLIESAAPFSPRERQVLALLLTDASEKEIARRLALGHRTVHQHAEAIYAKLGVRGRVGLMALWLRHRREGRDDAGATPSSPLWLPHGEPAP